MISQPVSAPALIRTPSHNRSDAEPTFVQMLDEGLVACANILGPMRSLFLWQSMRDEAEEAGVLFKTDAAVQEPALKRPTHLHPHDTHATPGWNFSFAKSSPADELRSRIS